MTGRRAQLALDRLGHVFDNLFWVGRVNRARGARLSWRARVFGGQNLHLGPYSRVFAGAVVSCSESPFAHRAPVLRGEVFIGERSTCRTYACLYTYGGRIVIGRRCTLNPFVIVYGHGGVEIGDCVRIAAHTVIVSANHRFDEVGVPIADQGVTAEGVRIADDVWIGAGARILDGVSVGKGAVIAAGAVVARNVPEGAIVGGVPAQILRMRDPDTGAAAAGQDR